jgi:hypothetical protein
VRFSIYARLPEPAYDALLTVAERDFRDPREQAAKFIVDGLRAAGVLPAEPSEAENDRADQAAAVAATA